MNRQLALNTVGRLSAATLVLLLLGACEGEDERPPPAQSDQAVELDDLVRYDTSAADARDIFASGECAEGTTQACRIYLPSHNGIQPCFVGEQVCVSAQWGDCESGALVDANAGDSAIDPDTVDP